VNGGENSARISHKRSTRMQIGRKTWERSTQRSRSVRQVQKDQFVEAHETLEVIRDLMMNARRRQDISYPLDALSDFDTTMEEIVKPALKLTPETVTDKDIEQLRALCVVADEKWKVAEASEFDLNLFGFEPSAAGRLQKLIEQERQAIGSLQAALNGKDKQGVIKAALGLKPPFAKTYMFFGDFPQPGEH
jgi:hypothetical protein